MYKGYRLLVEAFVGCDQAQYQLGVSYLQQKNKKKAMFWLKRASQQGNFDAIDLIKAINTRNYLFRQKRLKKKEKLFFDKLLDVRDNVSNISSRRK